MKVKGFVRTLATLVLAFALAAVLVACGGDGTNSADTSEGSVSTNESAASTATGELVGKPWVTSVLAGNLPSERPEAKDDL